MNEKNRIWTYYTSSRDPNDHESDTIRITSPPLMSVSYLWLIMC